ncbi:hypothetical protein QYF36_004625 [Acer negundo]|nr:hypothetical protein QYF36_004625 [Acer negundo]
MASETEEVPIPQTESFVSLASDKIMSQVYRSHSLRMESTQMDVPQSEIKRIMSNNIYILKIGAREALKERKSIVEMRN